LEKSPPFVSSDWKTLCGILPHTRGCLVCGEANPRGYRLRSRVENGQVRLDYTPRPEDTGYRAIVHGGVVMTLLDEVMTWAAILESRGIAVAAELTTRLHAPAAAGEPLAFAAWVVRANRRLVLTEGTVHRAGILVASASGKYMPAPGDGAARFQERDFVRDPAALDPALLIDGL
jgi:acyl-coenzyme A thioesterase PaaI-like protein